MLSKPKTRMHKLTSARPEMEKAAATAHDLYLTAKRLGIAPAAGTDWRVIAKLIRKGKIKTLEDIAGPSEVLRAVEKTLEPLQEAGEVWSTGARHLVKGKGEGQVQLVSKTKLDKKMARLMEHMKKGLPSEEAFRRLPRDRGSVHTHPGRAVEEKVREHAAKLPRGADWPEYQRRIYENVPAEVAPSPQDMFFFRRNPGWHGVTHKGRTAHFRVTGTGKRRYVLSEAPLEKKAEEDGHWRRLKPHQKGKGPGGTPQMGRTWVRRSRMKPKFKPMKHQASFTAAAKQQLGKKQGGGIIAAHGTGTGKTFSAINAFEELKGEGKARRALVLVPAGLRANFLHKGVEKFTTSKGVILQKPQAVKPEVEYVVVSYDAFRDNPDAWVDAVKPDTIIADEVHRAANPGSKTYQALMTARQRVPRFMGLTASVVQNKPSELVPLLALAEKGQQQIPTQRSFRKKHVKKEKSLMRGVFGGTTYNQKLVQQAMLRAKVGATVHYIEDLDASKKPTKEVQTVNVDMSQEQLRLYRMSMEGVDPVIRKKIAEGEPVSQKQAMNVFTRLMRARQVSNSMHLATANMTPTEAAEKTPKIRRILDDASAHIKKTPDAQVVMYTNMVHGGVDVLKAGLDARGIKYGVFAGRGVKGVTEETRQAAVENYLAGKNKVIIITGAGAEGLSLGNTTMVQLVDGHYNPERMAQAEARGVRAGGLSHRKPEDRRVRVRRYVSTLPKTFWQTVTFQSPEKSVGQWVYSTAGKKERLNKELREVLKARSTHEQKKRDSVLYRWFGGGP
jgi:hypothetical protein